MNVALLEPLGIVRTEGLYVLVPAEVLERVTTIAGSVVMGVPSGIWRCTVMVPEGTPTEVVTAVEVNTSCFAVTVSTWVALVISGLAAVRVGVPPAVSV